MNAKLNRILWQLTYINAIHNMPSAQQSEGTLTPQIYKKEIDILQEQHNFCQKYNIPIWGVLITLPVMSTQPVAAWLTFLTTACGYGIYRKSVGELFVWREKRAKSQILNYFFSKEKLVFLFSAASKSTPLAQTFPLSELYQSAYQAVEIKDKELLAATLMPMLGAIADYDNFLAAYHIKQEAAQFAAQKDLVFNSPNVSTHPHQLHHSQESAQAPTQRYLYHK